ncbi:MAG TPA: hypothetical protein VLH08_19925, partial [Acidobacteriota bacterium]|nr:hypothetical protein [Acidobacteriota bacterium]
GTPVEPTAPADFNVVKLQSSGGSALGGAVSLRPKSTISASWRNTEVSGQFIILEALDTFASDDVIMDGAVRTAPKEAWVETTRVTAKTDPTSINASVARSLISNEISLTTYRVCAVVPQLGDKGKVCSQPIAVQ